MEIDNGQGIKRESKGPLSYIFYFVVFVILCVVLAVITRAVFIFQKSTFSTSSYSVLVSSKNPFLISYNVAPYNISVVKLPYKRFKNKTQESIFLSIPIDGEIRSSQKISSDSFLRTGNFISTIFHPLLYSYEGMTILDNLRIQWGISTIKQRNIQTFMLKISQKNNIMGMSGGEVYDAFKDPEIINEGLSVQIVNATNKNGLAGDTGLVLKNTGLNVISIVSSDEKKNSVINAAQSSYTATRISHILEIPVKVNPAWHSISDLQIVIADDFAKRLD